MGMERFSTLLLEEDELLLEDFRALYRLIGEDEDVVSELDGWAKIGTAGIYFDPADWREPVLKFPIRRVELSDSHGEGAHSSLRFKCGILFHLKKHGEDHPHRQVTVVGSHEIVPRFRPADSIRELTVSLMEASNLPTRAQRERSLRKIVSDYEGKHGFDAAVIDEPEKDPAVLQVRAKAIFPLSIVLGNLRLSKSNLYFMPLHGGLRPVEKYPLCNVASWRRLQYGASNCAIEVTFDQQESRSVQAYSRPTSEDSSFSLMFDLGSQQHCLQAERVLEKFSSPLQVENHLDGLTRAWQRRDISNYEYLLKLNFLAGRSFCDLSQYPVFPWVLANYESEVLDLADIRNFRDLSKPIGALTEKRLQLVRERFREMPEPRFMWGTHYSSPAAVIFYLMRLVPAAMLKLQNGRFDQPNRLFHSIAATWQSVLKTSSDVKELIPEFFAVSESELPTESFLRNKWFRPGEFLLNTQDLDLGVRQDHVRVDNVILPPWAESSVQKFIELNREALESEHASHDLHRWIDLIFGYRSKSAEADNLFHTDVDTFQDSDVLTNFGRTPARLFAEPHPPRDAGNRPTMKTPERRGGALQALASGARRVLQAPGELTDPAGGASRSVGICGDNLVLGVCEPDPAIVVFDLDSTRQKRRRKVRSTDVMTRDFRTQHIAPAIGVLSADKYMFSPGTEVISSYEICSGAERTLTSRQTHPHSDPISVLERSKHVVVSGSADAIVVWRCDTDERLQFHAQLDSDGIVSDLAVGLMDDQSVLVAAGFENGSLCVWAVDLSEASGALGDELICQLPSAVRNSWRCGLCFVDNWLVGVSASGDLRLWSAETEPGDGRSSAPLSRRIVEKRAIQTEGTATCVAPLLRTGSFLVGTIDGNVAEYDTEGRRLALLRVVDFGVSLLGIKAQYRDEESADDGERGSLDIVFISSDNRIGILGEARPGAEGFELDVATRKDDDAGPESELGYGRPPDGGSL